MKTSPGKSLLLTLIAEATVDTYNELEQRMGFSTMLEEHLDMPFEASATHPGTAPADTTTCKRGMD
ncbi:MAG: calcium-binding protein [Pseudomonadota bacterium]